MLYVYNAILKNVVDGDTVDVTIDLGFSVYHTIRVRLAGIDTPEMNSPLLEERERAKKAKQFVMSYLGKQVVINTTGKDKYGRYIAIIFCDGTDLSTKLLQEGLAQKYE